MKPLVNHYYKCVECTYNVDIVFKVTLVDESIKDDRRHWYDLSIKLIKPGRFQGHHLQIEKNYWNYHVKEITKNEALMEAL